MPLFLCCVDCWYGVSCRYKESCMFHHPQVMNTDDGEEKTGAHISKGSVESMGHLSVCRGGLKGWLSPKMGWGFAPTKLEAHWCVP